MSPLRAALVVTLALACASAGSVEAASRRPKVRLVGKVARGQKVVVDRGGRSRAMFDLPPWVAPDEMSVSPSGRHALVFAKLRRGESRTAIVFDVSDVDTAAETGRFRPGVGGTFTWTPNDGLTLVAGCGTGCATVQAFDVRGQKLAGLLCDGFDDGSELSRDRRYVACFSTSSSGNAGELEVVDTTSGRVAAKTHLPCTSTAGVNRSDVRFDEARKVLRFSCADVVHRQELAVVVSWEPGEPTLVKKRTKAL
jgi:hypothetical protein